MLNVLKNRFEQGCKTSRYPKEKVQLLPRYRGRPQINPDARPMWHLPVRQPAPRRPSMPRPKPSTWDAASSAAPASVFRQRPVRLLHPGFCHFSVAEKEHLITDGDIPDLAAHSRQHFKKLFGRSLQLRQVSAAGCNACEADLNVLATPFFDLARFGINFVASPRHADGIVVTGPISRNMKTALLQTYEATPEPRVVIAVGSCTLSGGPFGAVPKSPKGWTPAAGGSVHSRLPAPPHDQFACAVDLF
jgi:Ni,Fe-hydrogenase III small subunit